MKRIVVVLALMFAAVSAAAAQHSVQLLGCSSPTLGVQYNFFRGTAKGLEATTPLNSSPVATCNYTDTTVASLQTYFYVAKAVCATCVPSQSGPSNEVTMSIPADPAPAAPTGLTVGVIAQNDVPLQWNTPPTQNGYDRIATEIFRGPSPSLPSPPMVAVVPASVHSFVDPGCGKKATCYYEIRSLTIKQDSALIASAPSNIVKAIMP